MYIKKGIYHLLSLVKKMTTFYKQSPTDKYFVNITEIHQNKITLMTMVKYHILTCGIHGEMPYDKFITSSLIYAVHPMQIFLLGQESGKIIIKLGNDNSPVSSRRVYAPARRVYH